MSDDSEDKDQKTEQPSQKRLDDALKRGQVPFSREVGSFMILMVLGITIGMILPTMMKNGFTMLAPFITQPDMAILDERGVGQSLSHVMMGGLGLLVVPFVLLVIAALAAGILQIGVIFSAEPMVPKLEKISVVKGFKRMFSMRSIIELLKGILKIILIGIIIWATFSTHLPELNQLPNRDAKGLLIFLSQTTLQVMVAVCVAMFFIAVGDVMYQRFAYFKNLRMSKKELKDEYKQQEGDPHIKQKLRQIRMERARNRMMADVPKADVVVTNPTHYAVALKYDNTSMKAPKVVAKGIDYIALNIKKIAKEHDITIMENPPLARALYASVEIDQEIPVEHYQAVAEIIGFVYKARQKKSRKKT